jgi:hypothetical protein
LEPNLTITFDRNPRPDANGPLPPELLDLIVQNYAAANSEPVHRRLAERGGALSPITGGGRPAHGRGPSRKGAAQPAMLMTDSNWASVRVIMDPPPGRQKRISAESAAADVGMPAPGCSDRIVPSAKTNRAAIIFIV